MNEYFCGKCQISTYSSVTIKDYKCSKCGTITVLNPRKEVKEHLKMFYNVTDLTKKEE